VSAPDARPALTAAHNRNRGVGDCNPWPNSGKCPPNAATLNQHRTSGPVMFFGDELSAQPRKA
jgi:hypothetical protein